MIRPTGDVTIRRLVIGDAPAYRRLRLAALLESPQSFSASVEDEAALSDEEIAARTAPPLPGVVFGAFADDAMIGMAAYVPNRRPKLRHKGTMVGVHVAAEWRGAGLGRRLVEAVIDHARSLGVILQCTVTARNEARRLYHGLGFRSYGLERDALFVRGEFLDEELLAIDLRPEAK